MVSVHLAATATGNGTTGRAGMDRRGVPLPRPTRSRAASSPARATRTERQGRRDPKSRPTITAVRVLYRQVMARGPPDNSESCDGLARRMSGGVLVLVRAEGAHRTRSSSLSSPRGSPPWPTTRSRRIGRCRHARRLSLPLTLPLNRRETHCYGFTRVGRICTVWPAHASTEGH
jgi:hypothetical protein